MHRLLIFGLLLLMSALGVREAAACSCRMPPPPLDALAQADAVLAGTVVELEEADGHWRVRVRVERNFKGIESGHVTLVTPLSSAACGYTFERGERYLIYAHTVDAQLQVTLCSRTARLKEARTDLEALDAEDLLSTAGGRCGGLSLLAALQTLFFVLAGAALMRRRSSKAAPAS